MASRRAAALAVLVAAGPSPSLALPTAAKRAQNYRDLAAEVGLSVATGTGSPAKNHIAESTGTGVAVLDYDQDGFPDLYFPNAPRWDDPSGPFRNRSGALYRNEGGRRFREVTEAAGVTTGIFGQGAVSADFDADGFPDLYLTALGPNLLFRNNGDGTFTEVGAAAGVDDPGWSIGAAFLDADGDGAADLFVANYLETGEAEIRAGERTRRWRGAASVLDGPRGLEAQANRFHLGGRDGAFRDAGERWGLAALPARYSMGVTTLDFDDDADPDLFVANDSGPNALLENDGGRFEEVALFAGVALSADGATQGSMGVAAADADGDGRLDLAVTNFAHDHYAFYRAVAPELFLEDAVGVGVAAATFEPLGWGAVFFDAENDGDLDLAFANGHLYPQVREAPSLGESYAQPDQLFVREGRRYRPERFGAPERSSRGMAALDFDADGILEIVVSNQDDPPTLWQRETNASPAPAGAFLRLRLVDPAGERDGLGARVSVTFGGRERRQWLRSGGSYASDSERRLHFGLGSPEDAARRDGKEPAASVEVRWRDGAVTRHSALPVRTSWVLRRGSPPTRISPASGRPSPSGGGAGGCGPPAAGRPENGPPTAVPVQRPADRSGRERATALLADSNGEEATPWLRSVVDEAEHDGPRRRLPGRRATEPRERLAERRPAALLPQPPPPTAVPAQGPADESLRGRIERAMALLADGDEEAAIPLLLSVVDEAEHHGPARLLLGRLAVERGEWAVAEQHLAATLPDPPPPEAVPVQRPGLAWSLRAEALRGLGRFEEALAAAERAHELAPRFLPPLLARSEIARRLAETATDPAVAVSRLTTAITAAAAAIAVAPEAPRPWLSLALGAEAAGRPALARCAADRLQERIPENPTAGFLFARLAATPAPEAARAAAEAAVAAGLREEPALWLLLGNLRAAAMDLSGAQSAYTEALRLDPAAAGEIASPALDEIVTGADPALLARLRERASRAPEALNTRFALAKADLAAGRVEEALAELLRLAARRPRHAAVLTALHAALRSGGREEEAAAARARLAEVKEAERRQWDRDNERELRRRRTLEGTGRAVATTATEAPDAAAALARESCERRR